MTSSAAELVAQIHTYYPDADPQPIVDAVEFAKLKHEGQTRSSGEPYYTHPLEVAGILADMKMDTVTIITAILHDTLEDTSATYEEIEKKFSSRSCFSGQWRQQAN
jgi:guanosine-3',5'-bis(diphosphate) 3'-pyrophosphohydrolase